MLKKNDGNEEDIPVNDSGIPLFNEDYLLFFPSNEYIVFAS